MRSSSLRLWIGAMFCVAIACGGGSRSATTTTAEQTTTPAEDGTGESRRLHLPIAQAPFGGRVAERVQDSETDFPQAVTAPEDAPNILLIMTDDVGFGAASAFGGPIPTPTMERVANAGIRYNRFHTTALCSPTRAALITGRNHHSVATGVIMEAGTGFPGYTTLVPRSAATIGKILQYNGYNTAWYGKNHNVPDWQSSLAGPYDLWPTGLGFEHFYGFIGGDTNQWSPALFDGTRPVEPPDTIDGEDFHLDRAMADRAIHYIQEQQALAPHKPFFVYYAPGTAHAPHHAPKEWIERFEGKFDQGWDMVRQETFERQKQMGIIPPDAQLTERPDAIRAWDSLNADQKKVYAHMMEVYAAALAHCDHQMGRVIDAIERTGELDNTIIIYLQGDNGASAEGSPDGLLNEMTFFNNIEVPFETVLRRMNEIGGPTTFNHYPVGWAHALDTPFQWTKQIASHFGGTRNGLAISWPAKIEARGEIRNQFHHVIDIVPTLLEAVGVPAPETVDGVEQKPIDGVSMMYTFADAQAPSRRRTQYFEMMANRAIYHDGWIASTTPPVVPWDPGVDEPPDPYEYEWELYNLEEDYSQANDLADQNPEKLAELQERFMEEARRYQVLPIDNRKVARLDVSNRPSLTEGRSTFTYFPVMMRVPEGAAPDLKNTSFTITAQVETTSRRESGMLATQGGRFAGWGLYLLNGKPTYVYNLADVERYRVQASRPIAPGEHTIRLEFAYDGGDPGSGGTATIFVDDQEVAEGRIERTLPFRVSLDETFDIGIDAGEPVHPEYEVPFESDALRRIEIRLSSEEAPSADEAPSAGD